MSRKPLQTTDLRRLLPVDDLMPGPAERALLDKVSVLPPGDIVHAYSIILPDGWYRQDTPAPDWSLSEGSFSALGVFTPEQRMVPPIVVSCGVTPMPEGLTVAECFEHYCRHEGLELLAAAPEEFLAGPVIDGLARKEVAPLELLVRLAMFEDGGHLYGLSAMAPAAVYPEVVRVLSLALVSFELEWPLGPTARLS